MGQRTAQREHRSVRDLLETAVPDLPPSTVDPVTAIRRGRAIRRRRSLTGATAGLVLVAAAVTGYASIEPVPPVAADPPPALPLDEQTGLAALARSILPITGVPLLAGAFRTDQEYLLTRHASGPFQLDAACQGSGGSIRVTLRLVAAGTPRDAGSVTVPCTAGGAPTTHVPAERGAGVLAVRVTPEGDARGTAGVAVRVTGTVTDPPYQQTGEVWRDDPGTSVAAAVAEWDDAEVRAAFAAFPDFRGCADGCPVRPFFTAAGDVGNRITGGPDTELRPGRYVVWLACRSGGPVTFTVEQATEPAGQALVRSTVRCLDRTVEKVTFALTAPARVQVRAAVDRTPVSTWSHWTATFAGA